MTQLEIYQLRSKRDRGCEPGRGSTFTIRLPKDCLRFEAVAANLNGIPDPPAYAAPRLRL